MVKRAWWSGSSAKLRASPDDAILGALLRASPFPVEQAQKSAWQFEIAHLTNIATALPEAHFFLEFAIPRMGRRADAVIVCGGLVFVLEYKVGADSFSGYALDQVHGYALDLKNFHASSHDKRLVPIVVASNAPAQNIGLGLLAHDQVASPLQLAPGDVLSAIQQSVFASGSASFSAPEWAASRYLPTPTIIEAAAALYQGHEVAEISRSEAGAENLTRTATAISEIIQKARYQKSKALIFVTGVPGAGKTLAGLNIACSRLGGVDSEDATFLSGNGPLVRVLRAALAQDAKRRAKDNNRRSVGANPTYRSPDKFIQNVHHFRDEYAMSDASPSEHVVIFDEAQRAWSQSETARFMREKRGHAEFDQSEPEFLLSVMNRHRDWCVVVCLVGEGQEINRGEAGIGAWIAAFANQELCDWEIYASPHLAHESNLSTEESWLLKARATAMLDTLHLAVSVRSFRAERVADWVAALLDNDADAAQQFMLQLRNYPIFRTRSLAAARHWLRAQRRANERSGILASSNAIRLKPEGLYAKAAIDPVDWFLKDGLDIRSSNALEDVATEFDVQGLEVDWAAVAWDLNLMRCGGEWLARQFRGSQWNLVRDDVRQGYVINAYRVLLTRARQGMVIFVPTGDAADPTRPPEDYDAVDDWLRDCGVFTLPG